MEDKLLQPKFAINDTWNNEDVEIELNMSKNIHIGSKSYQEAEEQTIQNVDQLHTKCNYQRTEKRKYRKQPPSCIDFQILTSNRFSIFDKGDEVGNKEDNL